MVEPTYCAYCGRKLKLVTNVMEDPFLECPRRGWFFVANRGLHTRQRVLREDPVMLRYDPQTGKKVE